MPLALVVTVPAADTELAADALWRLGVRAIEERRAGPDTFELWTHVGDTDDAVEGALAALRGRWPVRCVHVDDAPSDAWREHVAPIWIDERFVVVPAWQDVADIALDDEVVVVAIEPGGAFGMGDHPTTRLCLRALRRLVGEGHGGDVLDVGCGTGVIAVAAALLTDRPVRAVDVSSAAVEVTRANAVRNAVGALVVTDDSRLSAVTGEYDVVFANILAPTLIELADDLRRVTRPGGRLVISGVLDGRHDHVLAALAPLEVERTDADAGWVAVTLRR